MNGFIKSSPYNLSFKLISLKFIINWKASPRALIAGFWGKISSTYSMVILFRESLLYFRILPTDLNDKSLRVLPFVFNENAVKLPDSLPGLIKALSSISKLFSFRQGNSGEMIRLFRLTSDPSFT